MGKEISLGVCDLDFYFDSYEFCKYCLPKVKALQVVEVDEYNYNVSGWKEYSELLDSLIDKIPILATKVFELNEVMPPYGRMPDSFPLNDDDALLVREKVDTIAGTLQEYINVCEAVIAGKYRIYPRVNCDVDFESGVMYCSKLINALTNNPFIPEISVAFGTRLVDDAYAEPVQYLTISKSGREALTIIKQLIKLYSVAGDYCARLKNIRHERDLLRIYVSARSMQGVDFSTLDKIEEIIVDEAVAKLGVEICSSVTEENVDRARKCMSAFMDLVCDFDLTLYLDVDIEE